MKQQITITEQISLLRKKFWNYLDISKFCGVSPSTATKIKREILKKDQKAKNQYLKTLINSDVVIESFYGSTKEEFYKELMKAQKIIMEESSR